MQERPEKLKQQRREASILLATDTSKAENKKFGHHDKSIEKGEKKRSFCKDPKQV